MKFLKNDKEIVSWLNEYNIKNYNLIPNKKYGFVVDVYDDVNLIDKKLQNIPIKFNHVYRHFYCENNSLTSLDFAPTKVGYSFYCNNNQLTSLQGCPKEIGRVFIISSNNIKNWLYFPDKFQEIIFDNFVTKKQDFLDFDDAYKIHQKDLIEYEKQKINNNLKINNNALEKNNKLFKI